MSGSSFFFHKLPANIVGSLSGVEPQCHSLLEQLSCSVFFLMESCSFFENSALMFELVSTITTCADLSE